MPDKHHKADAHPADAKHTDKHADFAAGHHKADTTSATPAPHDKAQAKGDGKFKIGDKVKYTSGAICCVYGFKKRDDGKAVVSVTTDDGKHSFDCGEDELEPAPGGEPKPKREPRG